MGATTTYIARARRALLVKQNSTFWIGIGRTTPWQDEQNPPDPNPSATSIEEAIIYVKATQTTLCKPVDTGGDILINGARYQSVTDQDAIAQGARFLYLVGTINPTQMQVSGYFREHGITSNLVPAAGHENDDWLKPADIQDTGLLEMISTHAPYSLAAGEQRTIYALIEFK